MQTTEPLADYRFQRLQAYLQDDWRIDPPIFVRPVWHTRHSAQDAYHFILKRDNALHLLVVPRSADIDRFVLEQALPLNHL